MTSEVSGNLENVTRDEMDLDSCIRNVSVQTGEEFSPQFLQNLTQRRKLHVGGESSQEYQKQRVTSERTIITSNNGPQESQKDLGISRTIVQAIKEFPIEHTTDNGIPAGNVTEQYQQKRVGAHFNQNEQLVYEYHTGSRISKKNPVNGADMSEVWSGRGIQMEAEQTIMGYHQHPRQSSTHANEICNVQAAFYQTTSLHHKAEPKMKFLCSFGGRILTRPSDGKLRYVGGETRIISVRKTLNYQELMKKTHSVFHQPHIVKYQLPGEDLDALISVCSDEDFLHLIDEYNELEKGSQRLRIFLEPLTERESPCSSDVKSVQQTDSAYKYVVAVNGIPEPSLQQRSSRESPTVSPTDSITSLQRDSPSRVQVMEIPTSSPNLARKLPSPAQFVQTPSTMKRSCMQSSHMPFQYRNATNAQSRVDRDRVDQPAYENSYQLDVTNYNFNHLDNIVSGTYQQLDRRYVESHQTHEDHPHDERSVCKNAYSVLRMYGQGNVDLRKPMVKQNPNLISDMKWRHEEVANNPSRQNIVPSVILSKLEEHAPFVHMIKEKTETAKCENHPIISDSDLSKHYIEWDQDTIKWMEKNNLNLAFDLDAEECQRIVSPATPLERQLSTATTVSSESGLQHNTSLETSRPDVNAENPFLVTTSAESDHRILTSDFNENGNLIHDLVMPSSTVFAPKSSVSFGESSIDNLGDRSLSQTSEDVSDVLPPDILSSTIDFFCAQDKMSGVLTSGHAENEIFGQSNNKDVNDKNNIMNEPISDATMAEIQAGMHGLQTIKDDDLEELCELGCGTFGTVYHGKWRGTDVAIKRIKESCFAGKPSEQDRLTKDFWREAQILSQLHHPNVVALYGVVRDGPDGTLSTVTEYMANGSLRHVLSKNFRSLDRRKKIIIAQDAAIGMEYLHLKNIVHFDLKCDNLLVNLGDPERPVCKVGDFGLSRIKRNSLVSGGARGTLPWIAPELLDGSSSRVSEKVDVFSFGIAMWEILTGEEPYEDMHCGAIIGGIVTNTLRPPIPKNCHQDWKVLMEECWANDPADRPSFTKIAKKLQAMSMTLESKPQKRAVRQEYHHNHLYNPSIL